MALRRDTACSGRGASCVIEGTEKYSHAPSLPTAFCLAIGKASRKTITVALEAGAQTDTAVTYLVLCGHCQGRDWVSACWRCFRQSQAHTLLGVRPEPTVSSGAGVG